jgi:hypothetical protein
MLNQYYQAIAGWSSVQTKTDAACACFVELGAETLLKPEPIGDSV